MESIYNICSKSNVTAQDLYRAIASDSELSNEVLEMARRVSNNLKSLANAFIVLGLNTIRNIVLKISAGSRRS